MQPVEPITDLPAGPPAAFRESFDSFYQREHGAVVGLAYVLCGSSSAAEDLAQDAFYHALKNWEKIGEYDDPGAWVRRVVANHAVSRFRRLGAEARAMIRIDNSVTAITVDPDDSLIWDEVRRLPKRQAQAIALRYLDGRSVEDIASILECSENTVKTHLQRAKQTLAQRLEMETDDEDD